MFHYWSLCRSGIEENYDEIQVLLQDVKTLFEEAESERKQKQNEGQGGNGKKKAQDLRRLAMNTMGGSREGKDVGAGIEVGAGGEPESAHVEQAGIGMYLFFIH